MSKNTTQDSLLPLAVTRGYLLMCVSPTDDRAYETPRSRVMMFEYNGLLARNSMPTPYGTFALRETDVGDDDTLLMNF